MNWFSIIFIMAVVAGAAGQPVRAAKVAAPLPPALSTNGAATDLWRRVLAMSEADREAFINGKPAAAQDYLRAKVKEYMALSPADREARLRALEMRAMMLPLMKMSYAVRLQYLETFSPAVSNAVQQRLRTWDILPPPLQQDVLSNETVARMVLEFRNSGVTREHVITNLPAQRREDTERAFAQWDSMPEERREQILENVQRFMLDGKVRTRTLGVLSEADRARITPTVSAFERISQQQREAALAGYRKFKQLSAAEQQQFLQTAQRWEKMNDREKRLWRQIVFNLRAAPNPPPPRPPR